MSKKAKNSGTAPGTGPWLTQPAKAAKVKDAPDPKTMPPWTVSPKGPVQIGVALPVPTLEMLETEAAAYGWRRSQFLEGLIMHKVGLGLRMERRPDAPTYKFRDADWKRTERWTWYIRPELKDTFDALRMKAGNIGARAWIILAVNEWVGIPSGFGVD